MAQLDNLSFLCYTNRKIRERLWNKGAIVVQRLSTKINLNGVGFIIIYKSMLFDGAQRDAAYLHEHSFLEMHLILKGEGMLHTRNGSYPLSKGTCVLLGRNTLHRLTSESGNPLIRFELQLDYNEPPEEKDGFLQFLDETEVRVWRRSTRLAPFANALAKELSEKATGYQQSVQSYLSLILIQLMRLSDVPPETVPMAVEIDDEKVQVFTKIDNFFGQNYGRAATADELADILCVSRRQFYRIMQKYYGMTFKQQLIRVRLEMAKRLLEETALSVAEIADRTGYEYASSLCKAFKNKVGMSPEEYRKSIRKYGIS